MTYECLLCHSDIVPGSAGVVGDRIDCPCCEAKLEIVGLDPPELDWAYDDPSPDLWIQEDYKTSVVLRDVRRS